ncbi:hypothetical protein [Luteolibacter sp. LG18]|uniref:hypothetical protein n=1 Tax=Luteolibacter sp. LG18 TaxID=2819286 RepID=UPI0030C6664D
MEIIEMLRDDMVGSGFLVQWITHHQGAGESLQDCVNRTLGELLSSGQVEIGVAQSAEPDYVEFVAWRGSVEERVSRAMETVLAAADRDKAFAYWLCLRENVDRFE